MKTEFKKVRRKRYKWGGGEESADLYKRSKWLIDCDSSHSWGEVMKREILMTTQTEVLIIIHPNLCGQSTKNTIRKL